ncbi:hypothetical protein [Nocardia sp. NPDC046763]
MNGVVVTTASGRDTSDRFADVFAELLARHRIWRRATHAVPA